MSSDDATTADVLGGYELVREFARGGMATVFEARHRNLGRPVALKRIRVDLARDDRSAVERFIWEARVAAELQHPNIVTVHDLFLYDDAPYIAMELMTRGSLRPLVGHLSDCQSFGVLEAVLAGLRHAEQHGVAHRDLKPENLLVADDGALKIADFGIAKAYADLPGTMTSTGVAVGTPAYMAPEQALGQQIGPFTDLYAVGVLAFELFAGTPPFATGDTPISVLYRQVHDAPPRLSDARCDVPDDLAAWVGRMLSKQPSERPCGAAEAWNELEEIVVRRRGAFWRRNKPLTAVDLDDNERRADSDESSAYETYQAHARTWGRAPQPAAPPRETDEPPAREPAPDDQALRDRDAKPTRQYPRSLDEPFAFRLEGPAVPTQRSHASQSARWIVVCLAVAAAALLVALGLWRFVIADFPSAAEARVLTALGPSVTHCAHGDSGLGVATIECRQGDFTQFLHRDTLDQAFEIAVASTPTSRESCPYSLLAMERYDTFSCRMFGDTGLYQIDAKNTHQLMLGEQLVQAGSADENSPEWWAAFLER